eukprot:symbB.v1.2.016542.t1/scaffold1260.1/size128208/3
MQMFHHKTKKQSFRVGYHAATAANVGLASCGVASLVGKAGRLAGAGGRFTGPERSRRNGRNPEGSRKGRRS